MIRGNERFITTLYVGTDFLIIQLSFFIAWYCRFYFLDGIIVNNLSITDYFFWNVVYSITYIIIANFISLYKSKRKKRFWTEIYKIIQANVFSMFVLINLLYIVRNIDTSRIFLVIYFLLNLTFIIGYRYIVKNTLSMLRTKGYNKQFILVIGAGSLAEKFIKTLSYHPEYGFDILGFLDDNKENTDAKKAINRPILGKISDLKLILEEKIVDEVVIALPISAYDKYNEIIMTCEKAGVRVSIIPDFYDILPANSHFENFGNLPVINVRDVPLDDRINKLLKRLSDITISIIGIILTSPLLILIAVGVKLSSPGPILFKQERVGLNRRTFIMYKFRSMKLMSDKASNTKWTVENDPRRTKFGTFIRKTSLDELPQLFNVLKGDMSIVGPRPERPFFVDQFKEEIPKYMIKHQVRPGITGWAQVCGLRGDTSIKDRIEHDLYYIENWTLLFDFKIILKTIINGFVNKNAY